MSSNKNFEKLFDFLKNFNIEFSVSDIDLEKFSEDTSLFKVRPTNIIFPKSKNDISKILKFVNQNKNYKIAGRSAGTDMSGGPLTDSIVLSFTKYFNNIISINSENKESVVEPGVFYRDFEKETLKHNLLLPTFPASREICALGGMISNNSGGEMSLVYGKTENYVLSLETVLPNGEIVNFEKKSFEEVEKLINSEDEYFKKSLEYKIYKEIFELVSDNKNLEIINRNKPIVSKNSSGYFIWNILSEENGKKFFDLSKLIVGSQGTLAMVTKIKLKLISPKKYSKMMMIYIKDIHQLGKIRNVVMKYKPETFESYDDHTFKVAIRFLPAFIKSIFSKDRSVNIFKLAFSFWKEFFLVLSFGLPKLFLLVNFTNDDEKELEKSIKDCELEIKNNFENIKTQIIETDFEKEKYLNMRRESFNLLRKKSGNLHTAPFIDDIIVPGEKLEEFLIDLVPILDKYKLLYTIAGHVGDGNLHIIPLMDFTDKKIRENNIQTIKECSHEVYDLIKKYHGSITGEHNDGLIRTPFLNEMYDEEMLEIFRKIKNIFDENNILNPGKKVSINKDLNKEFENNLKFIK